jgi:hypothetical protein
LEGQYWEQVRLAEEQQKLKEEQEKSIRINYEIKKSENN